MLSSRTSLAIGRSLKPTGQTFSFAGIGVSNRGCRILIHGTVEKH